MHGTYIRRQLKTCCARTKERRSFLKTKSICDCSELFQGLKLITWQRLFHTRTHISELPSNIFTPCIYPYYMHLFITHALNRSTTTILTRKQYRFRARFVVLLKIKQKKYLKGQCQKNKLLAQTSTCLGIQKKFFFVTLLL